MSISLCCIGSQTGDAALGGRGRWGRATVGATVVRYATRASLASSRSIGAANRPPGINEEGKQWGEKGRVSYHY